MKDYYDLIFANVFFLLGKSMKMLHKGNGYAANVIISTFFTCVQSDRCFVLSRSSSAIHDVEEVYIEEQNRDLKFL